MQMKRKHFFIVIGVIIILIFAVTLWLLFREKEIEGILEGSGQVRGTEITVSSKLAGKIEKLLIKEGQAVKEGDLIAKISSKEIEARIEQANSQIAAFKRQKEVIFHKIHQAKAAVQRAEASFQEAKSQWNLAKKDYERYSNLAKEELISRSKLDEMETRLRVAEAKLDAAKNAKEEAAGALQEAEASYDEVNSLVDTANARLKEIEAIFKDTEIYAPSSGTIINKLVEEGELVAQGTPIATLVDLSDLYVKVYIPEKDIGKIRLGNPARIYTDAFPGKSSTGKVTEISEKAEFTPKEVHMKEERTKLVFGVKVGIENPEGYLKPGMPVDVKIRWKEDVRW